MRTKIFAIAVAALAVGALSSMAQTSNVYSANVVGYITVTLTNNSAYTLIANQLDLDGTGTNNTLYTSLGTNLPPGTKVLAFNPGTVSYSSALLNASGTTWLGSTAAANAALNPGGGVFVLLPASAASPVTATLVGNVLQGSNSVPISVGYQLVSYLYPVAGNLTANLGYNPSVGDKSLFWNLGSQNYSSKLFTATHTWTGGDPLINVSEAFFLQASSNNVWNESFTVGP